MTVDKSFVTFIKTHNKGNTADRYAPADVVVEPIEKVGK